MHFVLFGTAARRTAVDFLGHSIVILWLTKVKIRWQVLESARTRGLLMGWDGLLTCVWV